MASSLMVLEGAPVMRRLLGYVEELNRAPVRWLALVGGASRTAVLIARIMTNQLRHSRDGLEERVRERTRALNQLNDELRPAEIARESGVELRIVVIDDHRDTADSTRALLELAGHKVTVAYRAQDGIDAVKLTKPDVVFCDIELSDTIDGYAVARTLRAAPGLGATYLVAITGYGRARDKERARDAGFDLHLTKPVDLRLLERTIASRPVTR